MGDNFAIPSNFINFDSQLIHKKRKPSIGEKKEEANKLNENAIHEALNENILLIEHEIEEKKKYKIKLEENIQKIQKELNELNVEIENYERIKNSNLQIINIFHNNESSHEGKDDINNIMNNNKEENKINLFSFNQSLNLKSKQFANYEFNKDEENKVNLFSSNQNSNIKSKQFLNNSTNLLEKLKGPTIQNEITQKENQNSGNRSPNQNPYNVNTLIVLKNIFHQNLETINNKIEENKNGRNISEGYNQYSFKCLTDNLNYKIKRGAKEASLKIELENNGILPWPENETFLLINEVKSQKIKLCSLNPEKKCSVYINFYLDKLKPGKNYLSFYAKNKKFGNNITINIEIY